MVYSLIVSLLSSRVCSSFTKFNKIIGMMLGICCFIFNRKFLKIGHSTDESKEDSSRVKR